MRHGMNNSRYKKSVNKGYDHLKPCNKSLRYTYLSCLRKLQGSPLLSVGVTFRWREDKRKAPITENRLFLVIGASVRYVSAPISKNWGILAPTSPKNQIADNKARP